MNRKLNTIEILARKFKRFQASHELEFKAVTIALTVLGIHLILPIGILIYLAL